MNIKWKISLSNGETFHEDKGNYKIIDGEKSPYLRLLDYAEQNNLEITSVALFSEQNNYTFNLPSSGNRPRFLEFQDLDKPVKYSFFRKMGGDLMGNEVIKREIYSVIEAVYTDKSVQLWVDEFCNCWVLVRKL